MMSNTLKNSTRSMASVREDKDIDADPIPTNDRRKSVKFEQPEEWHLLEEDEDEYYERNNNNHIKNDEDNNNGEQECDQRQQHGDKTSSIGQPKKYNIDIEPETGLSPLLIYLCTALYSLLTLSSVITFFTLIILCFSRYYFISLIYLAITVYDRNTCNRGGRRLNFVYRSKFWTYLAAYFPIKLRRSANFTLNPEKNYILCYHPHGISAFGSVTAFATNGLKFSENFPGITARFMVHETSFITPILKETFALRGDCSVNSRSIDYFLSGKDKQNKTGNLLTIVIGGLAEADQSDAEVLKIHVAERKGFVKKALVHGADLIPCIAFGENSVFKKVNLKQGSFLHRLESKWYELFKFKHPIYYGRSIVSDKFGGAMPYKRPITVVMGDPIKIERNESPSQDEIDKLHAHYLHTLRGLYEDNENLCKKYDVKMEFV